MYFDQGGYFNCASNNFAFTPVNDVAPQHNQHHLLSPRIRQDHVLLNNHSTL